MTKIELVDCGVPEKEKKALLPGSFGCLDCDQFQGKKAPEPTRTSVGNVVNLTLRCYSSACKNHSVGKRMQVTA